MKFSDRVFKTVGRTSKDREKPIVTVPQLNKGSLDTSSKRALMNEMLEACNGDLEMVSAAFIQGFNNITRHIAGEKARLTQEMTVLADQIESLKKRLK